MFPPRSRGELHSSGLLAACSINSLPTFRDNLSIPSARLNNSSWSLKMWPVICPERSVRYYHNKRVTARKKALLKCYSILCVPVVKLAL